MIAKLIAANLTQRPVRTLLSVLLIAIPVTLMLTLVGLSRGFIQDSGTRARGVGADIIVRSPDSRIGTVGLSNLPVKLINRLEQVPHVSFGTGVASHLVSGWTVVSGIDTPAFERMSGKFVFREGHGFEKPDDILFDTYYAQQAHVHAGSKINMLNRTWNVAGIVEPGKLAHIFLPLATLQDLDGSAGKVAQIYLKLDNPANTNEVVESIKTLLPGYNVYAMEELVSLTSVDNVPFLRPLLNVIIGVAVLIGAAVASLSMYMAVQQRTREIGILKSLGASKVLVVRIILMEALFLGLGGSLLGIVFSFLSRWLLAKLVPASLPQAIVPGWWPIAGAIAMGAAILGALYPGIMAARQDP
ncbi:MAG TPA: FtsX-like permease family protein, partial [Candidatus Angelobacter sp.]|nr:FtsX-like permease family protein [Candidatus Angelobacter sp.]